MLNFQINVWNFRVPFQIGNSSVLIAMGLERKDLTSVFSQNEVNLLHSSFQNLPASIEEAKQQI